MMNKKLVVGGGAVLLIIVALAVYFLFFFNTDSGKTTGADKLSGVFDDFFKRMDEKYTIKSSKPAVQMMETVVGNSLKIAEAILDLPDLTWALDNVLFDQVDITNINNAISPFFDCMANKIKAIGNDPTLKAQWEAFDVDTNGFSGSEPVFVYEVGRTISDNAQTCFDQNVTNERISSFRTEYNRMVDNMNNSSPEGVDNFEQIPDTVDADEIKRRLIRTASDL